MRTLSIDQVLDLVCSLDIPANELKSRIREKGVSVGDQTIWYDGGMYYLLEKYVILVDDLVVSSQSTRAGAYAQVDKFCALLFFASSISVHCAGELMLKWVRLRRNEWVQRFK